MRKNSIHWIILSVILIASASFAQPNKSFSEEKISFTSDGLILKGILRKPLHLPHPPVILLCHGYADWKVSYDELAIYLVEHNIASFAFDFRGHYESEGPRMHFTLPEWRQDIVSALNVLSQRTDIDSQRISAFGFSSGGSALIEAALIDNRIKSLVLLDATTRNTLPWPGKAFIQMLCWVGQLKERVTGKEIRIPMELLAAAIPFADDPKINKTCRQNLRNNKYYWALPGGEAAFAVDIIKKTPTIKQPTLIIWGENDQVDPVESAHVLFHALRCEKDLQIIPGNGHAGHLDRNRQRVFELTADWIRRHS